MGREVSGEEGEDIERRFRDSNIGGYVIEVLAAGLARHGQPEVLLSHNGSKYALANFCRLDPENPSGRRNLCFPSEAGFPSRSP